MDEIIQSEVHTMSENEVKMLLEAIIILAEKAESKEELIADLERIKAQGNKK